MISPQMRNVFIKIKVPAEKIRAFASLYERIPMTTPLEDAVSGYSQEGDKHAMIVGVTLDGTSTESLQRLHALIVSLIDYYPALSECPSETQKRNAVEFRASLPATLSRGHKTAALASV